MDTCHHIENPYYLCDKSEFPSIAADSILHDDCLDDFIALAYSNALSNYELYKDSIKGEFETTYKQHCLSSFEEQFSVDGFLSEYHYTLYYYDQSGNLVRTIPPSGVKPFGDQASLLQISSFRDSSIGSPLYQTSNLQSTYFYNSLNQPIAQQTPDAGHTRFWYDNVGRLVASQDMKQNFDSLNNYHYIIYDNLNRIIENGYFDAGFELTDSIARTPDALTSWLNSTSAHTDVTRNYYDKIFTNVPGLSQSNLRGRISSITFVDFEDSDSLIYSNASHFSYDISGNVSSIVQENSLLQSLGQSFKRIDYEYDLISGKVNNIYYERDSPDQFIHHYEYDADNRLIEVLTSVDGLQWEHDARYIYYMHGPLARLELGENHVQGIDYAYTLQGWLKGINSGRLNPDLDMGNDGELNTPANQFARDAYGLTLGYYNSDYSPIDNDAFELAYNPSGGSTFGDKSYKNGLLMNNGLFNGNIRHSVVSMDSLNYKTVGYAYSYDQLNRLTGQTAFNNVDTTDNKWQTSAALDDYSEGVQYDGNGNILSYLRKGTSSGGNSINMDSLTYFYKSGTNQLKYVKDSVNSNRYSNDIDNQDTSNFSYDKNGNLTKDLSENLNYRWTNYGKLHSVSNTLNGDDLYFYYDAFGNRTTKVHFDSINSVFLYTFYVRDAQGNILATYQMKDEDSLKLQELNIYGSSRLGMLTQDLLMNCVGCSLTTSNISSMWSGRKLYELTNHLGNVLATVTDKRISFDNNSDGLVDWYLPEVASANDYYPFGMLQPGRNFNVDGYRFGFNGKENDNEIKGEGNQQDYGMRIYDSRIGKFLSVDPIYFKFPELSTYQFSSNSPIWMIDLDGTEGIPIIFTREMMDQRWDGKTLLYISDNLIRPVASSVSTVASGLSIGLINFGSQVAHFNFENYNPQYEVFSPAAYRINKDWKFETIDGAASENIPWESGKEILKANNTVILLPLSPAEEPLDKIIFAGIKYLFKESVSEGMEIITPYRSTDNNNNKKQSNNSIQNNNNKSSEIKTNNSSSTSNSASPPSAPINIQQKKQGNSKSNNKICYKADS